MIALVMKLMAFLSALAEVRKLLVSLFGEAAVSQSTAAVVDWLHGLLVGLEAWLGQLWGLMS